MFTGRTDVGAETPILWPPDVKSWLIWKDPDAGNVCRWEAKGQQRMRLLDGITNSMNMNLAGFWERVMDRDAWSAVVHGVTKSRTQLNDWTELNWAKAILRKKNSSRNQVPWLQTILQSYSKQNSMTLSQKQKYRSMQQNRKPRNKPTDLWSINLWQRGQN